MRPPRPRRPSPALVISLIALLVALGGTSYAALKLPKNSVGTKQLRKNAVTGAKVRTNSLTGADIQESTLAKVPSASKADTATSAGTADNANALGGAPSSAFQDKIRWALVAPSGVIIRQSGGIGDAVVSGAGIYEIDFGSDVSGRAILATQLDNGTTAGTAAVASCDDTGSIGFGDCAGTAAGNPRFIKVVTTDAGVSAASAQPFYVAVIG